MMIYQTLPTEDLDVEKEFHHVTFCYHILLPFTAQPTLIAGLRQGSGFQQLLPTDGLRANKPAFEVGGQFGSLGAVTA